MENISRAEYMVQKKKIQQKYCTYLFICLTYEFHTQNTVPWHMKHQARNEPCETIYCYLSYFGNGNKYTNTQIDTNFLECTCRKVKGNNEEQNYIAGTVPSAYSSISTYLRYTNISTF